MTKFVIMIYGKERGAKYIIYEHDCRVISNKPYFQKVLVK